METITPGKNASSVMLCAQNVERKVTLVQYASVPEKPKMAMKKEAPSGADLRMKVASLPQTSLGHPGPRNDKVNGAKQVHIRASKEYIGYLAFANQTRTFIVMCCITTALNP